MFDVRKISSGEFLYKDGSRVEYVSSPHKSSGWSRKRRFLVIHYTAAGPASGSVSWFANPNSKVSSHLTIGRDGTITQSVPFNDRAWHAGSSSWVGVDGTRYEGLNSHAIGIELANAGACNRTDAGTWKNDLGVKVAPEDIVEAAHKNGPVWFGSTGNVAVPGWETFPTEQVFAVLQVAIALVDHYKLEDVVGHDDISPGRKFDPGPLFNINRFRGHVFGRSSDNANLWTVRKNTPGGLAIRQGPSKDEPKVQDKNLKPGTLVEFNESTGNWWFVTVLDKNGNAVVDGWVYSRYLVPT